MTSNAYKFDSLAIRDALARIEDTSQESLAPPPLSTMYIPPGHAKALSLSSSVVIGLRGTGKSYWTAVLNSKAHRDQVARAGRLPELSRTEVSVGFALDPSGQDFPSTPVLSRLLQQGVSPDDVWHTIVLHHSFRAVRGLSARPVDWEKSVRKFAANREAGLASLAECDRHLESSGRILLVLFDALDRIGSDWEEVRQYLRSLLKFCLQCRSRRAIRLKIFLRPDMEEDEEIWNFVDSSKLRANRVELSWRAMDLFGLLLLYLANNEFVGPSFRKEISRVSDISWVDEDDVYQLPRQLGANEQPARLIVETITGPWMGTSAKRGYVYTWVPTHLADAKGRLSPRSFLLAFREAAEWTEQHESDIERALDYKGIQQGVTKASEIRVGEISEDYPWVRPLLEAARGLTVPCEISDLTAYWKKDRMAQFRQAIGTKLPPRRYGTDLLRKLTTDALIEDLVELAILYRTEDDRLNIPDIFRVGFGIRRMGGVRPPK